MAKKAETEISVLEVHRGWIEVCVLGTSPLIHNAMSAKARQQLLMPPARKNAAEKASSLKHEPINEFKRSMYRARNPKSKTEIVVKATAFKGALMGAALDLPGAFKTQIGRLTYVEGDEVQIYGVPQLMMAVTRSADKNRTPDVRTRAIIPEWACMLSLQFTKPLLKEATMLNLLAAAGITQGIGDWRIGKGNGNYGGFELVGADNEKWNRIVAEGTKQAQLEAIEDPVCYDSETEELLSWHEAEVRQRGFKAA